MTHLCRYCERDFCDADCYFADRHGDGGIMTPRKTAAEFRDEAERATIQRVAAWLDSHLGGGTCGLSIGEIASDFADELRSGAWKEPTP